MLRILQQSLPPSSYDRLSVPSSFDGTDRISETCGSPIRRLSPSNPSCELDQLGRAANPLGSRAFSTGVLAGTVKSFRERGAQRERASPPGNRPSQQGVAQNSGIPRAFQPR